MLHTQGRSFYAAASTPFPVHAVCDGSALGMHDTSAHAGFGGRMSV